MRKLSDRIQGYKKVFVVAFVFILMFAATSVIAFHTLRETKESVSKVEKKEKSEQMNLDSVSEERKYNTKKVEEKDSVADDKIVDQKAEESSQPAVINEKEKTSDSDVGTVPKNTSKKQQSIPDSDTNVSNSEKTEKPSHTHKWVEQTSVISHPATGHNEQVLVKEAWTEEIPIYEEVAVEVCNICQKEIVGEEPWEHGKKHALAGEGAGGNHTEWIQKQTGTQQINHPAEYTTRWVEDKAAWTETVVTGYKCSCGATK